MDLDSGSEAGAAAAGVKKTEQGEREEEVAAAKELTEEPSHPAAAEEVAAAKRQVQQLEAKVKELEAANGRMVMKSEEDKQKVSSFFKKSNTNFCLDEEIANYEHKFAFFVLSQETNFREKVQELEKKLAQAEAAAEEQVELKKKLEECVNKVD